ncbi:MAG TPA: TMEM175 family protein [Candidatus Sulfotelmatobacter sp.]|nr:TMEM175 family protein [Candidatus Sulfotelmatobacter sp.]
MEALRELAGHQLVPPEPHFRWRGGEITRLEGFTDAVFAFAVTLLVVSLEVPHTFHELVVAMKGFAAFAICFTILVRVWYYHYIYSRRYGLQTTYTFVLNAILLFVVLFYVYPLKFLFTLVMGGLTGGLTVPKEELDRMFTSAQQIPALMIIYSIGYIAVCVLFALLYHYAYQKRVELELNEYEAVRTRHAVIFQLSFAGIGVLVILAALALPVQKAGYSGLLYSLKGVAGFLLGSILGKRERLALARIQSGSAVRAAR